MAADLRPKNICVYLRYLRSSPHNAVSTRKRFDRRQASGLERRISARHETDADGEDACESDRES
jgi:hypothetical protein